MCHVLSSAFGFLYHWGEATCHSSRIRDLSHHVQLSTASIICFCLVIWHRRIPPLSRSYNLLFAWTCIIFDTPDGPLPLNCLSARAFWELWGPMRRRWVLSHCCSSDHVWYLGDIFGSTMFVCQLAPKSCTTFFSFGVAPKKVFLRASKSWNVSAQCCFCA